MKKLSVFILIFILCVISFAACDNGASSLPDTSANDHTSELTTLPEPDGGEFMRVGFLYAEGDAWRLFTVSCAAGDTPKLPDAFSPDEHFSGWELDGKVYTEPFALESRGELEAFSEPEAKSGTKEELLALLGECHYGFSAKYTYPESVSVSILGADGNLYIEKTPYASVPSASLVADAHLPATREGERASVVRWLCSSDGVAWQEYSGTDAVFDSFYLKPEISYSYLLTIDAGSGSFAGGKKLEFWLDSGVATELSSLTDAPSHADDERNLYKFKGYFGADGSMYNSVALRAPMSLCAEFDAEQKLYTVTAATSRGELPMGGKSFSDTLRFDDASALIKAFREHDYGIVEDGEEKYQVSEVDVDTSGTVIKITVKWHNVVKYNVSFVLADGERIDSVIYKGDIVRLPQPDARENAIGKYLFFAWRSDSGALYSAGVEHTVVADITFTAEWMLTERRIHTVVFKTDRGVFANGKTEFAVSGYYGEPIVPPQPPTAESLTYNGVVFSFAGWNTELPLTFSESAEYYAVYTTEREFYTVTYLVNGEPYHTELYYGGTPVSLAPPPLEGDGAIFYGWTSEDVDISGGSFTMPYGNILINGELEVATFEVLYYINGVLTYTETHPFGATVDLRPLEVKHGYGFSYTATVDVVDGKFVMPASNVRFNGEFTPNIHKITLYDGEGGNVLFSDNVEFSTEFSIAEIAFYREGEYSSSWYCIEGSLTEVGDGYIIMPDCDLVFAAKWSPVLTVCKDGEWLPYFGGDGDAEADGFLYDEESGVLYIYDPEIAVAGESEGIRVVFELPEPELPI